MYLLSKWKLWFVDVAVLSMLVFRCLITYLLFKFTLDARPGFEHIDVKELQDSVVFIFLPALLLFSCNWKIDSLLSFPIFLVAQLMTLTRAFSTAGDNMICYTNPETVGGQLSMRWGMLIFVVYYSVYSTHTH